MSINQQASLPTLFTFFPLFRSIVIREGIQIIHGHQATSALAHEVNYYSDNSQSFESVFSMELVWAYQLFTQIIPCLALII